MDCAGWACPVGWCVHHGSRDECSPEGRYSFGETGSNRPLTWRRTEQSRHTTPCWGKKRNLRQSRENSRYLPAGTPSRDVSVSHAARPGFALTCRVLPANRHQDSGKGRLGDYSPGGHHQPQAKNFFRSPRLVTTLRWETRPFRKSGTPRKEKSREIPTGAANAFEAGTAAAPVSPCGRRPTRGCSSHSVGAGAQLCPGLQGGGRTWIT